MKRLAPAAGLAATLLAAPAAQAALFGDDSLAAFCEGQSVRETVVYIDTRILDAEKADWARRLRNELMENLSPREPISIVALNSVEATANEVWSSCYPDLWPDEPRESGGLFEKSTERKLEDARGTFRNRLNSALNAVFTKHKTEAEADAPARIARALASDTARYTRSTELSRVIIYSDMLESSDLADLRADVGEPDGRAVAEKLGTDFGHAMIYGFGVAADDGPDKRERASSFFEGFFSAANGYVQRMSAEVALPSGAPIAAERYDLTAVYEGQEVIGRMVLLPNSDGALQDSYIFFPGQGRGASISGTFTCREQECKLQAETHRRSLTDATGETLKLQGSPDELTGKFGWLYSVTPDGNKAYFEVTATRMPS